MYNLYGLGDTAPAYQVTVGEAQIVQPTPSKSTWATVADVFRDFYIHASRDKRVLAVNNGFQLLWRSALSSGIPLTDPFMVELDQTMARWWQWKLDYDSAMQIPWISDAPDWNAQLDGWAAKYEALVRRADGSVRAYLQQRYGVDDQALEQLRASAWDDAGRNLIKRLSELTGSSWFWPVTGTIGIVWIAGKLLSVVREFRPRRRRFL